MKRFKKLKMCICFAAVGTMLMASVAHAQQNFYLDKKDTYTQSMTEVKNSYTKDQKKAIINQCEVINPDNMYLDDAIKKYVKQTTSMYKIYDLRSLSGFGLFSIKCGSNKVFNYGVIATDDFLNPSFINVYCKCSDKDFNDYYNYAWKGISKNADNEYIKYVDGNKWNMYYVQSDNILRINIRYK